MHLGRIYRTSDDAVVREAREISFEEDGTYAVTFARVAAKRKTAK